jgi:hypothetical protein
MVGRPVVYDPKQLGRYGDGIVAAAREGAARLQAFNAEMHSYGAWWNPGGDPNDIIGNTLGGFTSAVQNMVVSTGQNNLDHLRSQGAAIQAMAKKFQQAEDANATTASSIGTGA